MPLFTNDDIYALNGQRLAHTHSTDSPGFSNCGQAVSIMTLAQLMEPLEVCIECVTVEQWTYANDLTNLIWTLGHRLRRPDTSLIEQLAARLAHVGTAQFVPIAVPMCITEKIKSQPAPRHMLDLFASHHENLGHTVDWSE
jgi:hypothetical protein